MKLSQVKASLTGLDNVEFQLENGKYVPEHFHVTEVGLVTKRFIDCGGTVRNENAISFQLWDANDYEHRLKPAKLLSIIKLSEEVLKLEDLDVEVEYQGDTIGRYELDFNGKQFILKSKTTACLATDACGVTDTKQKLSLNVLGKAACSPNSGCC